MPYWFSILFLVMGSSVFGQNSQLNGYLSWFNYTRQDVNRNFNEDVYHVLNEKDSASFHLISYSTNNPLSLPNFKVYLGDSVVEQVVIESTDLSFYKSFSAQLKANKFRTLNADVNGNFITTSYDNEVFLVHQDYQAIDNPNGKGQIAYYQYRIHRKFGVFDALNGEKTKMLSENGVSYVGVRENFKNGLLSGERTLYYPNGTVKRKENYQAGRLNGLVSDYNSEGKLIHTSTHSYHWKYGMEKWYNGEGKVVKSLQWQRDIPVGVEKQTYNGIVVGSVSYVKGVKQGLAQIPVYDHEQTELRNYPDTLSIEPYATEIVNFENGLKTGKAFAILFNSKDTLYVANYKQGVLDSTYTRFRNSAVEYTTTYVNGLEDGVRVYRISSGALKDSVFRVMPYFKGKLNGRVEQFYVKNDYHALTIEAAGVSLKYTGNHLPKEGNDGWVPNSTYVSFKNGVKDGPFQIVDDSLNYMKGTYLNRSFNGQFELLSTSSNQTIKKQFVYEKGLKNGEQIIVSINKDSIVLSENFSNGVRNGVSALKRNGKLVEERIYENDTVHTIQYFTGDADYEKFEFTKETETGIFVQYNAKKGDRVLQYICQIPKREVKHFSDSLLVRIAQDLINTNGVTDYADGEFRIQTPTYTKTGSYKGGMLFGSIVLTHKNAGVYEQLTYENNSITSYGYTNVSNSEVFSGRFISAINGEDISVKDGLRHGWCIRYNAAKNEVSRAKYVKGVLKKTIPLGI